MFDSIVNCASLALLLSLSSEPPVLTQIPFQIREFKPSNGTQKVPSSEGFHQAGCLKKL